MVVGKAHDFMAVFTLRLSLVLLIDFLTMIFPPEEERIG